MCWLSEKRWQLIKPGDGYTAQVTAGQVRAPFVDCTRERKTIIIIYCSAQYKTISLNAMRVLSVPLTSLAGPTSE